MTFRNRGNRIIVIDSNTGVHQDLLHTLEGLPDRTKTLPGDLEHWVTKAEFFDMLPEVRTNWRLNGDFISKQALNCPVESHWVAVSPDEPDVRVYWVGQADDTPKPCIVHFHGGGLISGQAKDYLPAIQAQALALNCLIATVEYRLAPEHPFPAALNDGYAVLKWLHEQAAELNVIPEKIGIQGESAGGGLGAMVSIRARDEGLYAICSQALIYPMLDDRTVNSIAGAPAIGRYRWTPKLNRLGWSAFLNWPESNELPPYGSVPARVDNLMDLPHTFIWVGGIDLFVSEDLAFSKRLVEQGVPVDLFCVPGVFHAFDVSAPSASVTMSFRRSLMEHWSRIFGQTFDSSHLALFSDNPQSFS